MFEQLVSKFQVDRYKWRLSSTIFVFIVLANVIIYRLHYDELENECPDLSYSFVQRQLLQLSQTTIFFILAQLMFYVAFQERDGNWDNSMDKLKDDSFTDFYRSVHILMRRTQQLKHLHVYYLDHQDATLSMHIQQTKMFLAALTSRYSQSPPAVTIYSRRYSFDEVCKELKNTVILSREDAWDFHNSELAGDTAMTFPMLKLKQVVLFIAWLFPMDEEERFKINVRVQTISTTSYGTPGLFITVSEDTISDGALQTPYSFDSLKNFLLDMVNEICESEKGWKVTSTSVTNDNTSNREVFFLNFASTPFGQYRGEQSNNSPNGSHNSSDRINSEWITKRDEFLNLLGQRCVYVALSNDVDKLVILGFTHRVINDWGYIVALDDPRTLLESPRNGPPIIVICDPETYQLIPSSIRWVLVVDKHVSKVESGTTAVTTEVFNERSRVKVRVHGKITTENLLSALTKLLSQPSDHWRDSVVTQ